ncbi:MAG: DegT/DnrJ/EryC1/StrS family aminotransferase, partial [Candidatus Calescibacterium sp.]|nr:DegT/DnrJ/EryC1/StrS family aminotransferase [Candidatus Calescibacterium sp.]
LPTAVIDEKVNFNRDDFFDLCKKHNIDSRPFFYPLSSLPMFESQPENKIAYSLYKRGINLPSFHEISWEDIQKVVNTLKYFCK